MKTNISYWKGVHCKGTKDYEAWALTTGKGGPDKSICIKRYGKIGAFGCFIFEELDSGYAAQGSLNNIRKEKTSARKGYNTVDETSLSLSTLARLIDHFPILKQLDSYQKKTLFAFLTDGDEEECLGVAEELKSAPGLVVDHSEVNKRRAAMPEWGSW